MTNANAFIICGILNWCSLYLTVNNVVYKVHKIAQRDHSTTMQTLYKLKRTMIYNRGFEKPKTRSFKSLKSKLIYLQYIIFKRRSSKRWCSGNGRTVHKEARADLGWFCITI